MSECRAFNLKVIKNKYSKTCVCLLEIRAERTEVAGLLYKASDLRRLASVHLFLSSLPPLVKVLFLRVSHLPPFFPSFPQLVLFVGSFREHLQSVKKETPWKHLQHKIFVLINLYVIYIAGFSYMYMIHKVVI